MLGKMAVTFQALSLEADLLYIVGQFEQRKENFENYRKTRHQTPLNLVIPMEGQKNSASGLREELI